MKLRALKGSIARGNRLHRGGIHFIRDVKIPSCLHLCEWAIANPSISPANTNTPETISDLRCCYFFYKQSISVHTQANLISVPLRLCPQWEERFYGFAQMMGINVLLFQMKCPEQIIFNVSFCVFSLDSQNNHKSLSSMSWKNICLYFVRHLLLILTWGMCHFELPGNAFGGIWLSFKER